MLGVSPQRYRTIAGRYRNSTRQPCQQCQRNSWAGLDGRRGSLIPYCNSLPLPSQTRARLGVNGYLALVIRPAYSNVKAPIATSQRQRSVFAAAVYPAAGMHRFVVARYTSSRRFYWKKNRTARCGRTTFQLPGWIFTSMSANEDKVRRLHTGFWPVFMNQLHARTSSFCGHGRHSILLPTGVTRRPTRRFFRSALNPCFSYRRWHFWSRSRRTPIGTSIALARPGAAAAIGLNAPCIGSRTSPAGLANSLRDRGSFQRSQRAVRSVLRPSPGDTAASSLYR